VKGPGAARFVRAVDRLAVGCAVVAAACLVLAMLIVVWMVIWRATGHSTYWEIELATYLIVATVLVGSPYTLMTHGHIGVDLLGHYMSPGARKILWRILAVAGFVVCIYLAWKGLDLTLEAFEKNERSGSAWNPPRWPFFALMPFGLGLTALQYVAEMLREAPPPVQDDELTLVSGQGA
jgi:TRAP-type C4-dicarboxylate transport system permease small subunit